MTIIETILIILAAFWTTSAIAGGALLLDKVKNNLDNSFR